jgi:hypothetical protein
MLFDVKPQNGKPHDDLEQLAHDHAEITAAIARHAAEHQRRLADQEEAARHAAGQGLAVGGTQP